MKNKKIISIAICFILALLLAFSMQQKLLFPLDSAISDKMFQEGYALSGNVVIIGIDSRSLDEFGPWPWDRKVIAEAIDKLNEIPEQRPAAIGTDIIFGGETNPESDQKLVEAAGKYGNVVVACNGEFGSGIFGEGENIVFDDFAVKNFVEPFPALKAVTKQGHINSMFDTDGILRHSLFYLTLQNGEKIPSFAYALFSMFADHSGLPAEISPSLDSLGRYYQVYAGEPEIFFDGLGVSDLLAGDISPDFYADKIVLIGPADASLQDFVLTSADHAKKMYGTEYQANAVEAMIQNEFRKEAAELPQAIALFAVIFIFLVWLQNRKIISSVIAFVVIAGAYIGLCFLLGSKGLFLHPLYLPAYAAICFVGSVGLNYYRAAKEKKAITNTFKKYVAPEIVADILKQGQNPLDAGGKLTDVAVLFVDIRGFTPMSESLSPVQVVEILNKYLTLTSESIMSNGGTLDKFIGDATMAFWGAPLPQEDYIFKAVKAALAMVEGSKALGQELLEKYGKTVSFGIGVHCGPAVIGNIGAKIRMDYTAIGDTVNTAARLESNAPAGKVLISRAVADALEGRIKTTSLGDSIKLKGKSEGFEILTLDGLV